MHSGKIWKSQGKRKKVAQVREIHFQPKNLHWVSEKSWNIREFF